ncbi:hypothetical protein REC_9 [Pseudomonas phage REC]|nr:hypothetical protein REC_9 [Pseudomonas phage REC]
MEQLRTPRVCNICGAREPEMWFDAPMNETIRAYARSYISPVKEHYPSLYEAARAWGTHEGLEHDSSEIRSSGDTL